MLVYVINKHGKPLMPCKPSKARRLLKQKKAKVIKKNLLQYNYCMVQVTISKKLV